MGTKRFDLAESKKLADVFINSTSPLNGIYMSTVEAMGIQLLQKSYIDNFQGYDGPALDGAAGSWLVTSVDAGVDAGEVVALQNNATGGKLQITTNDADNDSTQIQKVGSSWQHVAGKQMWFFCEVVVTDADDAEIGVGMVIETATDMTGTFPTDGIFFEKAETATQMDFHVIKDSVDAESTLVGPTLADATAVSLGFHIAADTTVTAYAGASLSALVPVATVAAGSASTPDDEDLTFALQVQAGAAAAETIGLNYLYIVQEL